ncbi:MAG: hypothetical protein M3Z85_16760 [Acidobacteriota bacterium]|nr:hypothetical protein [Acidobacteriota bacterium]
MFFRRASPKILTFTDYLDKARAAGFTTDVASNGRARIMRDGVASVLEDVPGAPPRTVERAGIAIGNEIASLVDGGFQKFFQTPSGKRKPALAEELKAVHAFQEDLREALGLVSLYNESLGTVSNVYLYDRVEERDSPEPKQPWEVKL